MAAVQGRLQQNEKAQQQAIEQGDEQRLRHLQRMAALMRDEELQLGEMKLLLSRAQTGVHHSFAPNSGVATQA